MRHHIIETNKAACIPCKALKVLVVPVAHVQGENSEGETLRLVLESYSRAYWRFEQKFWGIFKSILYYNEYPVILKEFEYKGLDGTITREDLGKVVGNAEHAWGFLA